jgi:hypothetical protein
MGCGLTAAACCSALQEGAACMLNDLSKHKHSTAMQLNSTLLHWLSSCRFDAATGDIAALRRLMAFSRRFVQGLRVQQLPSHLDLQLLFNAMEHSPASLSVSYGQRCVGMDYDRGSFGASLADCRYARCRTPASSRCCQSTRCML